MMASKEPTFAQELRAWRAREGYTQVQAAAVLKVKYRTYETWETGRYQPEHLGLIRRAIQSLHRKARS